MPSMFKPALEKIVQDFQEARKDSDICPHEYLALASDACQTIESMLDGIGGNDEQFELFVQDCEQIVRQYVVPYDIPFIKPFVENVVVDPNLVNLVRPALTAIRPKPHDKEKKTPPVM